jgi:hypothetical protein
MYPNSFFFQCFPLLDFHLSLSRSVGCINCPQWQKSRNLILNFVSFSQIICSTGQCFHFTNTSFHTLFWCWCTIVLRICSCFTKVFLSSKVWDNSNKIWKGFDTYFFSKFNMEHFLDSPWLWEIQLVSYLSMKHCYDKRSTKSKKLFLAFPQF